MPAEKMDVYPLSSAQKRVYVMQRMNLEDTSYNMPFILLLKGKPVLEKLERAFNQLIQRHEVLRTSFEMEGKEVKQRVHRHVEMKVDFTDLSTEKDLTAAEADTKVNAFINGFVRPFDLSTVPIIRAGLLKTPFLPGHNTTGNPADNLFLLTVDTHHIISDGTSHDILLKEFEQLYGGAELPELNLQYRDFSQWQNRLVVSGGLKKQENYWLEKFKGDIPVMNMPLDFPRSSKITNKGADYHFNLAPEESKVLLELALEESTTIFSVVLALFNILLHKITSLQDILVGTVSAGRNHSDLERIIGMFINTLVLRNRVNQDMTFTKLLREVRKNTLEAFDNQAYQFEDLVENVVTGREQGRHPLFDILFSFAGGDIETPDETENQNRKQKPDFTIDQYVTEEYEEKAKFDMIFSGFDNGEHLAFVFNYSTELFKAATIKRLSEYFKDIVAAVVKDRSITIGTIDIAGEDLSEAGDVYDDSDSEFDF